MKTLVLLVLSFSVAVGATADSSNIQKVFGSAENLAIATSPEKIEACILRYFPPPDGREFGRGERYEEDTPIEVPKESGVALQKLLFADSTYRWDVSSGCWPRFQARLRFHREGKIVVVDFCFGCHLLVVSRDDKIVGGAVFDDDGAFLAEIKRIFPKHPALTKPR